MGKVWVLQALVGLSVQDRTLRLQTIAILEEAVSMVSSGG
jgi:hypothetical protein